MKILIVDDEKNVRNSISKYLQMEGYETEAAQNGLAAQKRIQEEFFHAAVVDLKMPGMSGQELLSWIKEEGPGIPTVIISAFGEVNDAVEAMKNGANDYLVKPFEPGELVLRIKRAIEHGQANRNNILLNEKNQLLDTGNAAMQNVYTILRKAAPTDSTVLITGESGTGKEVLGRHIHSLSKRNKGNFVAINLGGIPDTLLESELFGYEKGAFTGADKRKTGMFELAAGGTLFLDEIGELPLQLQVKLLRVLQEKKIQRLGSTGTIPINTRIITATNRNLEQEVENGNFREDLFYRLNVIRLKLPPLRERMEDLPELVGTLLKRLQQEIDTPVRDISHDALEKLKQYPFPGNIRELENILERAVILCETHTIMPRDIDLPTSKPETREKTQRNEVTEIRGTTLKDIEKEAIKKALLRHEGRRDKTASELGISRRTLLNKINDYDIKIT